MVRMSGGGISDPGMEGGNLLMTLEPWQIILIVLAAAVVLGIVIGVLVGKYQVRRASSDYKPLLSFKERALYLGVFVLGVVCVLLGAFNTFTPSPQMPDMMDGGMIEGIPGIADGGMIEEAPGIADGGMIEEAPDIADGGEVIMPDDILLDGAAQDSGDVETDVDESAEVIE